MNVALYTRVSSVEQAQGHSLDDQRARLAEWAEREGWAVVEVYEDAGISATDALKRPAFQRMVRDATLGRFQRVLVKRRDRYARNVGDAATYDRMLAGVGVSVWSLEEPATNDDTPAAFLMRGMSDVMAEHYSRELRHKTSQGWRRRALKGLQGGDVPFGYVRTGPQSAPAIEPTEAEAVRMVFESYAAGSATMPELAAWLNSLGLRTRAGRRFTDVSVHRMLSNPFYQGDITYRGEVVAVGAHEPIVDRATFERATEARKRRAPIAGGMAHASRPYLLSGVGVCAECGRALWANAQHSSAGVRTYYRCSARARGMDCSASRAASTESVEAAVAGLFAAVMLPEEVQARVFELAEDDAEARRIEAERQALRARIARIEGLAIDGVLSPERAQAELREARGALGALPDRMDSEPAQARWALSIPRLWPDMTPEGRRALVRASLDQVAVDLSAASVAAFKVKPELEVLFEALVQTGVCVQVMPFPSDAGAHIGGRWLAVAA